MAGLAIDPTDTAAASRPLFSREIVLVASNFITHPSRATEVRVGRLRASLTDSTLAIRGVRFAPTAMGAERSRREGRNLVTLTAGHVAAAGVDVGAFVLGLGIRARHVALDSFRLVVINDKRVPKGPPGPPHRTPQQWIADLEESLSLDSLRLRNGEVVHRQHAVGRERPGVLAFTRIEAAVTNVNHVVGWRTSDDPMTVTASALVQGAGRLDVQAVMPLDARRFDMTIRGTLGAMSAPVLNAFLEETGGVRIESGQVVRVGFSMTVRNGVATGTVTPVYRDLSLSVTRSGSEGILGAGGILGGIARLVANTAAGLKVRGDNPGDPDDPPRSGTIRRTFTDETLIAFLWRSLRDGLLSVLRK
jgi:hypothetical protein